MFNVKMFCGQSKGDGPGIRFVLWVSGCNRHCIGCANKYLWDVGKTMSVENMSKKIFAQNNIEGITLCGGEPFLQAESLSRLAKMCKERGLSVMTFTGFLLAELNDVSNASKLLEQTDILIDGPYMKDLPETKRHWVGSSNQNFYFLTDRYISGIEYPKENEKIIGPRNNFRGLFERI